MPATIYVGRDEAEVRRKHGLDAKLALRQDEDVLDTWFSSALWPFSTLGWPDDTPELAHVLSDQRARHELRHHFLLGRPHADDGAQVHRRRAVPRGLHPCARARPRGRQDVEERRATSSTRSTSSTASTWRPCSRSAPTGSCKTTCGPSIEKITRKEFPDGIEGVGTDALRFTFASLATTGRDARFDLARAEGYHRFCNKLWNASAYVLSQLDGIDDGPAELGTADRWIRSRLGTTITAVHDHFATYRLDLVAQTLYDFAWHELCDWYLELTKAVLTDPAADRSCGAARNARWSTCSAAS